jgi:hypothetical protein
MRGGSRASHALIAVVATMAGLAFPMDVSASMRWKSITIAAPPNSAVIGTAIAKCPSDELATGGGFRGPAQYYNSPDIFESRKKSQRLWRVSAKLNNGDIYAPLTATLTSFVYCSADAPETTTRAMRVPGTNSGFDVADARCSSGSVQAGGFLLSPFSNSGSHFLVDSFRVGGRTWRTRMYASVGQSEISYAYCAHAGKPSAHSGSATLTGGDIIAPARATVSSRKCTEGTSLVAGGFSQPDATIGPGGSLFVVPWESFRKASRWRVSAFHAADSPPDPSTLTSIAYCR